MKTLTSLAALVVYLTSLGCSAMQDIPVSSAHSATDTIYAVIYPSGEVVEFNEKGGIINSYTMTIHGVTRAGAMVSIPVADVLSVRVAEQRRSQYGPGNRRHYGRRSGRGPDRFLVPLRRP